MNRREIENLVVKALFKEISDEEQHRLDEWLGASESNRALFERLHSENYLKGAIGDHNRRLREERWQKLKKETVQTKERSLRSLLPRVAAVLTVVGGCSYVVYVECR